jgi:general secretion pathway protein D
MSHFREIRHQKSFLLFIAISSFLLWLSPPCIMAARVTGEDTPVTTEEPQKEVPAVPTEKPVERKAVQSTVPPKVSPATPPAMSAEERIMQIQKEVLPKPGEMKPSIPPPTRAAEIQKAIPGGPAAGRTAKEETPARKENAPSSPKIVEAKPFPAQATTAPDPKKAEMKPPGKLESVLSQDKQPTQPPAMQAPPLPSPQQAGVPAQPVKEVKYVTVDFDNVDIQVFIKFVSELTGKNFVIDDKVKGKVSIVSPKKIAVDEVYKVFESVLDVYGFTTITSGDIIKVIPSLQAKEKSVETRLPEEEINFEDRFVTQIIALEHASTDEMKKVLDPLVSKSSVVLSYPPTGMLVVTDVQSNVKRLQKIIDALDVEGVGEQISYIPLKYASAAEALKSLNSIFQQQKGTLAPIKIVSDERANAVIILATENDTVRVKELVNLMDKEIPKGSGMIRVYYLQHAKAEDLAKVLTTLPQQTKAAEGKVSALSKTVQIVADKATNSLIITADAADYLVIEDVIKKLDIARPMVYLEALIMEVNTSKNFTVGVEWMGANDISSDGKTYGYVAGGSSGAGGKYNVLSGLTATPSQATPGSLPAGLSFGVIGQAISISTGAGGSVIFPNLAAFIQAYQSDSDLRILSTPQLLTLDNEEAEISVGSNIPYVTRQERSVSLTGTDYSNYDYKDIGVSLKVTPMINKEGFIRLKIEQVVTKLDTQTQEIQTGVKILAPTTLKRTAKTTVTVRSGDTVVIGGMIEDQSSSGISKVPFLGDIPLLGWLFKSKSTTGSKTNLFVFITPRIIRKPEDAMHIHEDKKEYMRTLQEGTIKTAPPKKKEEKRGTLSKEGNRDVRSEF